MEFTENIHCITRTIPDLKLRSNCILSENHEHIKQSDLATCPDVSHSTTTDTSQTQSLLSKTVFLVSVVIFNTIIQYTVST